GPDAGDDPDRFLRGALWTVLGLATLVFWAALRPLPWLGDPPRGDLTGRQLLHELPLPALAAGGVLLLVFVASVTLCLRPAPWLWPPRRSPSAGNRGRWTGRCIPGRPVLSRMRWGSTGPDRCCAGRRRSACCCASSRCGCCSRARAAGGCRGRGAGGCCISSR